MKIQQKIAVLCASAALFICGFLLGYVRAEMFLAAQDAASLAPYVGKGVEVEGRVVDDTDRRDASLRVTIRAEKINGVELPKAEQGKLIASLPRDEEINFNDRVVLKGELKMPDSFETDTGHIFDYPKYLEVRGVSALMSFASVEEKTSGGFSIVGTLFSL